MEGGGSSHLLVSSLKSNRLLHQSIIFQRVIHEVSLISSFFMDKMVRPLSFLPYFLPFCFNTSEEQLVN